ncbi:MAG: DUF2075 domain-containing protein [Bacteroidaceae bacterium]|nr:DUF2075 domain-containing protein [Bacteroidaceae bacterium]
MTSNNYISLDIQEFLNLDKERFTGLLNDPSRQTQAWENQRVHLQSVLKNIEGRIIFEYGIPGLQRVIDVILLVKGLIFVLEYKNWETEYKGTDKRQALGYALRLKFFHNKSNERPIIPILVATDAEETKSDDFVEDDVWDTICCNSANLRTAIDKFCNSHGISCDREWEKEWEKGNFKSSPTIIRAACNVWERKNVKRISNSDVNSDVRLSAEDYIERVAKEAYEQKKKAIVFVTGVPGAGKTLVGLDISIKTQQYGASMISGNNPLVAVLSAALRRDLDNQYKNDNLREEVRSKYEESKVKGKSQKERDQEKDKISVDTIIRGAYSYKKEIIERRLSWEDSSYTMKPDADLCSQHVVIFDEAQRAWTIEKMLTPRQSGKKEWQKKEDWPFSEPGLLLWDMNQQEWGVFVCLVGGGQEIHTGEAGICEWLRALTHEEYKDWEIHMSNNLIGEEYGQPDSSGRVVNDYVSDVLKDSITISKELHLTEAQRTLRSELVSNYVNGLIEQKVAHNDYVNNIKKNYTIYLTRDIRLAKEKLTQLRDRLQSQKETFETIDDIKMGMLMSSSAERLRPLGYEVKKVASYGDAKVAGWFLDRKEENVDSCDSLEVALDEFFVQGLELDLCCVMWDADFRHNENTKTWDYFNFKKCKWNQIVDDKITGRERTQEKVEEKRETNRKREIARFYMKNAYRVLLTRARMGMIICVPEGNSDDPTRLPEFYDSTYNYLKSLGLSELK